MLAHGSPTCTSGLDFSDPVACLITTAAAAAAAVTHTTFIETSATSLSAASFLQVLLIY